MVLVFDSNVPQYLKKELETYINDYKSIIPSWVHRLVIHYEMYDEETKSVALEVIGREEYRTANIIIYPSYTMIEDEEYRKLCVLHELCHMLCDRLRNIAYNLASLLTDAAAIKLASDQIRVADESATQDLAESFKRLFDGTKENRSKRKSTSTSKKSISRSRK